MPLAPLWRKNFQCILSQVSGMPLCTLLGGNHQDDILLYRAISQGTPKEMSALVQKYKTMVCIILVEFLECYVMKHPILCIIQVQGLRLCFFFIFGSDRQKYTSQIWFDEGFGSLRCGHFINYNQFLLNQWCAPSMVQILFWEKKSTYCKAIFIFLFQCFFGGF